MTRVLDAAAAIVAVLLVVALTEVPVPSRAFFVVAAALTALSFCFASRSWVMSLVVVDAAAVVSTFILREFGRCPTIVGDGIDLRLFVFILCCVLGVFAGRVRTAAAGVAAGVAVAFFYPLSDTLIVSGKLHPVLPLLAAVAAVGLEILTGRLRNAFASFVVVALAPVIALLPSSLLLMAISHDAATSALATAYVLPSLAAPATAAAALLAILARAHPTGTRGPHAASPS